MNIGKLPPFMAMTLGLASCEAGMNVCLSSYNGPYDYTTGDLDTDNPMLTSTGIASGTLGQTETSADSGSGTDTSTGPCLGAPMDSSGTDTDTGTGTGTGTDTGTDTGSDTDASSGTEGSSSDGGMLDEPPPQARAAAVERVLSREILPADVLDRLRALVSKAKG